MCLRMRYAPNPAPSKAELDRVKRVLFPTNDDSKEEKEGEFHSLPLTGEEEKDGDEAFESITEEEEEEEEKENMSLNDKESKTRRKRKGAPEGLRVESIFRLDPNVEVFRETKPVKSKRTLSARKASTSDDVSSSRGASPAAFGSPSPRRFEPPFKTPPSTSASAQLFKSMSCTSTQEKNRYGEKTPPFKTPPRSPLLSPPAAPKGKGERK